MRSFLQFARQGVRPKPREIFVARHLVFTLLPGRGTRGRLAARPHRRAIRGRGRSDGGDRGFAGCKHGKLLQRHVARVLSHRVGRFRRD